MDGKNQRKNNCVIKDESDKIILKRISGSCY